MGNEADDEEPSKGFDVFQARPRLDLEDLQAAACDFVILQEGSLSSLRETLKALSGSSGD